MLRRVSLLAVGIGVAAIALVVATQLLLLSFETSPLFSQSTIDSIVTWIQDRPKPGPGILAGSAIGLLSIWLIWSFVRSFGTDRRVITTRRENGSTRLDRSSLEGALERELKELDRRNDVNLRITRRGRIDATLRTPDPSMAGPANELREAIEDLCTARALPCRPGRVTVTTPSRRTGRRRVR